MPHNHQHLPGTVGSDNNELLLGFLAKGRNQVRDFLGGIYKSVVFGGLVSLVAVYFGYSAKPTGAGVGTATTNTVVLSSVLILIFDFIMTSFFA